MTRFEAAIKAHLHAANGESALRRFRAIGVAFLTWAIHNPTHFQIISNRSIIDFEESRLRQRNDAIRETMHALMREAQASGHIHTNDLDQTIIAARALGYGLARMFVDGQFPSWGMDQDAALRQCIASFDLFLEALARPGAP